MASQDDLSVIKDARVLVVGAGGVGCELLKTLALSGFEDIEIIDAGTIEVRDLNGQSLFRQSHVGQSKAKVARDAVLRFRPHINIRAYHKNVVVEDIDSEFFMEYDVILSALGNLNTRRHVNRLALDADVPLIDSVTTGFEGQVTLHVKEKTGCFECELEFPPKTNPVCNTTSTPSEFLISAFELLTEKLFGDRNQDNYLNLCSRDVTSPSENPTNIFERRKDEDIEQYGRRIYDHVSGYDIEATLSYEAALFNEAALNLMYHVRPKPVYLQDVLSDEPTKENGNLNRSGVIDGASMSAMTNLGLKNPHAIWSLKENSRVFLEALKLFFCKREKAGNLDLVKYDQLCVEFVTAAANIRAAIFGFPKQSVFEAKGISYSDGQVLPTTNLIIAGLIVIEAIKVLKRDEGNYRLIVIEAIKVLKRDEDHYRRDSTSLEDILSKKNPIRKKRIVALEPFKRNKSCYVCSADRVYLEINTHRMKLRGFVDRIVTGKLGVNSPLITNESTDLYGDDEEELDNYEANLKKVLSQLSSPVTTGTRLEVGDTQHRDDFGEKQMLLSRTPVRKNEKKAVVKGAIPSCALPFPAGEAEAPAGNKRKPSDRTRNHSKPEDSCDDNFDLFDAADSKASKKRMFR